MLFFKTQIEVKLYDVITQLRYEKAQLVKELAEKDNELALTEANIRSFHVTREIELNAKEKRLQAIENVLEEREALQKTHIANLHAYYNKLLNETQTIGTHHAKWMKDTSDISDLDKKVKKK